ncbi:MAG: hypothetical protein HRU07_07675 [Nitrosopumilus sp.]|nr:hypothetical protein [Nitrosopumilus sp.]NRA06017.1 hypothetical protein [Nitrosopumilus sp.]
MGSVKEEVLALYPKTKTIISICIRTNPENIQGISRSLANEEFHKNYDEVSGGIIKMKKSSTTHTYYGQTVLMYPLEGDYGFLFLTPDLTNNVSSTPMGDGIVELHIESLSLHEHIEDDALFHVYASNPSANQEFGEIAQAFSYIVIAIGILQLRKELVKGLIWIRNIKN